MKLTKEQLRDLLKKGNCTLDYAHSILGKTNRSPVAGLPAAKPEPSVGRELSPTPQVEATSKGGLRYRVLIIRCGTRLLDDDNIAGGGAKWIRDAIAAELGIDDGDPAIEWEYDQVRTRGAVGTIIRIERL